MESTAGKRWLPTLGIAVLMLPLVLWWHVTPHHQALKLVANPAAALVGDSQPPPPSPPSPPPPKPLEDWQLALYAANATGLAPPVFLGNWRRAAGTRLRWFTPDGLARSDRPDAWWGYPDPLPADANATALSPGWTGPVKWWEEGTEAKAAAAEKVANDKQKGGRRSPKKGAGKGGKGVGSPAKPKRSGGGGGSSTSRGKSEHSGKSGGSRSRKQTGSDGVNGSGGGDNPDEGSAAGSHEAGSSGGGFDEDSAADSSAGGATGSGGGLGGSESPQDTASDAGHSGEGDVSSADAGDTGSGGGPGDSTSNKVDMKNLRRRHRHRRRLAADSDAATEGDAATEAAQAAATKRLAGKKKGGKKQGKQGKKVADKPMTTETWFSDGLPLQERGPWPDAPQDVEERSYYIDWIYKDLEPWKEHGITERDVQNAWDLTAPRPAGPYCYGDSIHFQIVGGRLYVDYQTNNKRMEGVSTRETEGWFPGSLGPGLTAAKGHMPYVLFTLLDVLRAFPGQVPDVSAVLHTSDFPCLKEHRNTTGDVDFRQPDSVLPDEHFEGHPIPVFGYNRKAGFHDIPFVDFTAFGHEYSQIVEPDGKMINGWEQQVDLLVAYHGLRPLEKRKSKIMWRGRASDEPRDAVRRRFQQCPQLLEAAGHTGAKEMFDVVAPPLHEITSMRLMDNGEYRYPVYIDAGAYVSNLKHKLAVGSPLLMVTRRYDEWYSRALHAGVTHIDIPDDETMCNATWEKVQLMEALIDEHEAAVAAAGHPAPALQLEAGSWDVQRWGGVAESFLRPWTLASRGIAVRGLNAYEDSDMYVAPPTPLPELLGGDGNATAGIGEDPGGEAASESDAAFAGSGTGQRRRLSWLFGSGSNSGQRQPVNRADLMAELAERDRIAARREWAQAHRRADKARQAWERRQDKLKRAIPWDLWSQAEGAWGTGMLPWEIAAAGQIFARDRLRLRDVRLYVRDLLVEYSRLQKFQPRPTHRARCIDWERMLEEFAWPHYSQDLEQLLFFYPYLTSPFNYNCSTDPHEADRAPYSAGHDGAGDWDKEEAYQAQLRRARGGNALAEAAGAQQEVAAAEGLADGLEAGEAGGASQQEAAGTSLSAAAEGAAEAKAGDGKGAENFGDGQPSSGAHGQQQDGASQEDGASAADGDAGGDGSSQGGQSAHGEQLDELGN